MLKRNLLKLLTIWLVLKLSTSCSSVPDVNICAEISISKGVCTTTVSSKTTIVDDEHPLDGATWFDIRSKALTVPAKSWAKIKAFLIKQCKQRKCNVDIDSWDRQIDRK